MKPIPHIFWIVAVCTAVTGNPVFARAEGAASELAAKELQALQGTWEEVVASEKSGERITVTINGDNLRFHRDTNFWFQTTITLPAGAAPKQLHATIKDCPPSQASSIGEVVVAIYQIKDGKLTIAPLGEGEKTPTSFEALGVDRQRFELRKAQPRK